MHPCTEFDVASSKFTFTGGPHVKTASSPLARAAGTRQEQHPQWILSWCSTRVTCEFGISGAPRVTCRAVRNFVASLHGAARATCHVPPDDPRPAPLSFRRFGASIGATPRADRTSRSGAVPGNAWTHTHTDKHQPPNFFSPTYRRKSSFIRTCYAKALAPFILYDFGLFLERTKLSLSFELSCTTSGVVWKSQFSVTTPPPPAVFSHRLNPRQHMPFRHNRIYNTTRGR